MSNKDATTLTVRDMHAAAALAGDIANSETSDFPADVVVPSAEVTAVWCYMMADLMMVEREKDYSSEENIQERMLSPEEKKKKRKEEEKEQKRSDGLKKLRENSLRRKNK